MPKKTIGNENYSIELDKVAGWNRQTVADGVWLNNNTIRPLDKNEEVLASAILYTSAGLDYVSAGLEASAAELHQQIFNSSSYLQEEVDTLKAASDVIMVYGTYAAFEANSGDLLLTDLDVVKVLHDESQAGKDQVYYQWTSANDTPLHWEDIGSLDPYYNTTEIDTMFGQTSSYINQTSSQLYDWLEDSASTLHQEVQTVSSDLFGKLQTSANTLHNEISTVSSDLNTKLTTSAAKLKDEIDFTSAWLDSAYAVNGSKYIEVTSGADVFGKQQTFTVGLQDEPYELDAADENVRIYEENDKTLVSAYPWNTFYAIPNTTEFNEIKAAYDKGHTILVKDGINVYNLVYASSLQFAFIRLDNQEIVEDYINEGLRVECWECNDSYGNTNWQKTIGYSSDFILTTKEYVDYMSSATSGNAFAKSSAYTNSTSAELYSWMQGTSGKTDVSGSLFIKSSKTTKPDGTNTFTMELDTGKFLGENIRITSASNGMTFSAKNYDQAIKDTSANAVSVANAHADAASGFALDQAKAYARETSASSLAQAKTYAETASGAAYNKSKADLGTVSAATYNKSKDTTSTVSGDLFETIQNHSGARVQTLGGLGNKDIDSIRINKYGTAFSDYLNAVSGRTVGSSNYSMLGFLVPMPETTNKYCLTWDNMFKTPKWDLPDLGSYTQFIDEGDGWSGAEEELNSFEVEEYVGGNTHINFKSKHTTSQNLYLVPAPAPNRTLITNSEGVMQWGTSNGGTQVEGIVYGPGGASYFPEKKLGIDTYTREVSGSSDGTSYDTSFGYLAPSILTGNAGKVLKVNRNENGLEWKDAVRYIDIDTAGSETYTIITDAIDHGELPVLYKNSSYGATDYYTLEYRKGNSNGYVFRNSSLNRYGDTVVEYTVEYGSAPTAANREQKNLQLRLVNLPTSDDAGKVIRATGASACSWDNVSEVAWITKDTTKAELTAAINAGKYAVFNYDEGIYFPMRLGLWGSFYPYFEAQDGFNTSHQITIVDDTSGSGYRWELRSTELTTDVRIAPQTNSVINHTHTINSMSPTLDRPQVIIDLTRTGGRDYDAIDGTSIASYLDDHPDFGYGTIEFDVIPGWVDTPCGDYICWVAAFDNDVEVTDSRRYILIDGRGTCQPFNISLRFTKSKRFDNIKIGGIDPNMSGRTERVSFVINRFAVYLFNLKTTENTTLKWFPS